jgi:phosphoribosylanthranilate isomerase
MTCLVKICGITNLEDAQAAIKEGADWLGFVFVEESPRSITPAAAHLIIESLPDTTKTVGVFQNEKLKTVNEIANQLNLNYVQLHSEEELEYCDAIERPIIQVLKLYQHSNFEQFASQCKLYSNVAEFILVDRPKELKMYADWLKLTVAFLKTGKIWQNLILAGGLNCDNIRYVIDELSPYGIDCASGVEASPGVKDHKKLKQFMSEIKGELVS